MSTAALKDVPPHAKKSAVTLARSISNVSANTRQMVFSNSVSGGS